MKLAQAAVNQHQAGHFLFFPLKALVAAVYDFAHGGKVIHAFYCTNDELTIVGLLHAPVFPHHHGGHGLRALNVGNVEALDALRQFGKDKHILQRFLNSLHVRFHHPEALIVRLLGVVSRKIE